MTAGPPKLELWRMTHAEYVAWLEAHGARAAKSILGVRGKPRVRVKAEIRPNVSVVERTPR